MDSWSGICVAVHRTPPQFTDVEIVSAYDLLCLHLDCATSVSYHSAGQTSTVYSQPGTLCLHAKQESRQVRWEAGIVTTMHLYLSPALLTRTIVENSALDPARVELVGRLNFQDSLLQHLLLALRDEFLADDLFGQAYQETLSATLAHHLLRHYATRPLHMPTTPGNLSWQQVSRVRDYIYDHIAEGVSLTGMAATLGFSISYFTRLFKEATGISPYQYVIQCRLERAQHLLQDPRLTVAEVAQQVGFTDQSHLHRHLKRSLGLTPSDIRRVEREGKNIQKM
ncbi:helix-turn-helix domain-containing protein [Ktedonospora formicarum]|nr:AraC family transcriptional regulator [Ktedonospora formicarum]